MAKTSIIVNEKDNANIVINGAMDYWQRGG